ncbi:hypothetical protein Pa4123_61100 [Phytohabitans aurantiacus]|uniref:Uncharacterized protein n=2 Tax=Phytohabitans aurantiacus TaxID=3016789 RepID=A0ABQ5R221_9ACTN|nr:hypothetical protein Pa4123_61100 [Phytohabitans aurantiacus]
MIGRVAVMSKLGRKSLAVAFSAFAIAGALVVPTPAYACGTSVTYGSWTHIPDTLTWQRKWTWNYFNCSGSTVRRKVVVNNGPDSSCYTIAPRGTRGYSAYESNTAGYRTNQYENTVSC